MTSPAPRYTDSECADVRVRPPGNRRVVPIRPDLAGPSARPHAIPRSPKRINNDEPGKIRDFLSQHAGEVRESLAASWLGQDRPQNLTTLAKTLGGNPAGWFRLAVYTIAYLACFAVDTNKRATSTAALLALSLLTAWTIAALAH